MHSNLLHYEWHGKKQGKPILFLHGFMGSTADWQTVFKMLEQKLYCLAVDLPGHGKTKIVSAGNSFSISSTAEHVLNILDREHVKTCALVGYSMGGRLALYLALHFPHRFIWLVVESASPGLASETERTARRKRDEQLVLDLENRSLRDFLKNWYDQPLFASLKGHPYFIEMFARRLQNDPQGLANSLRFMGTGVQPSLWAELDALQPPTLLLAGELDKKFIDIAYQMESKIHKSKLRIINNCGHNIHFENPQAFSQEILKMEREYEFH